MVNKKLELSHFLDEVTHVLDPSEDLRQCTWQWMQEQFNSSRWVSTWCSWANPSEASSVVALCFLASSLKC
jgi:hypothetical protein